MERAAGAESMRSLFDLTGRVAVITGGAGLVGGGQAAAVRGMGATAVLLDIDATSADVAARDLRQKFGGEAIPLAVDITMPAAVDEALPRVLERYGHVDILINNAANNPTMSDTAASSVADRLEHFTMERWESDIAVGLTGAFLCSKVFGTEMARRGRGVILNILSDLAVVAPDQRIYQRASASAEEHAVKPVSYSVVKTGLLGLTRYLATYWATSGIRVNALSPAGVLDRQDPELVQRISDLIPLGRMAFPNEFQGAVVFLVSDASSFVTGANLMVDGGRTVW